jgi:hypothetical protein
MNDGVTTIDVKKADKVDGAVGGNIASLDANGNIQDSGVSSVKLHITGTTFRRSVIDHNITVTDVNVGRTIPLDETFGDDYYKTLFAYNGTTLRIDYIGSKPINCMMSACIDGLTMVNNFAPYIFFKHYASDGTLRYILNNKSNYCGNYCDFEVIFPAQFVHIEVGDSFEIALSGNTTFTDVRVYNYGTRLSIWGV